MNDTESFEHVMAEMRKVVMDDCYMTRCNMYDDDCYQCQQDILDRLQRAHERELEHIRKAEYARGYHDGQHSMDAEHYAVALRLMHLPLDEDSHGNLSQIARAVYHADFGWTQGACSALRDELVRLMGGDTEPNSQISPILVNLDGENGGEVTITDELRKWASDNTVKDVVLTTYPEQHGVYGILEQLIAIADRIDEQEHKLRKQRDGFKRAMCAAQDLLEKRTDERDELKEKLDSMTQEYIAMRSALEISSSAMKEVIVERDELQAKLDAIREAVDAARDDNART